MRSDQCAGDGRYSLSNLQQQIYNKKERTNRFPTVDYYDKAAATFYQNMQHNVQIIIYFYFGGMNVLYDENYLVTSGLGSLTVAMNKTIAKSYHCLEVGLSASPRARR